MKSAASRQVLYLTETAAMTALLIILQAATKPAGQYVTGTCVNAVLALSVLAAGLWSGVAVALLSPVFAFLLGIGPQLLPIVPSIAAGDPGVSYTHPTRPAGLPVGVSGRCVCSAGGAWYWFGCSVGVG